MFSRSAPEERKISSYATVCRKWNIIVIVTVNVIAIATVIIIAIVG